MLPRPNPWLDDLKAYVPGKAGSAGGRPLIKLSANENPFGPSPLAVEAMRAAEADAHRYPEGSSRLLREAIAAKYGLDPARVLCGAGSDDLLHLIGTAFLAPGDEALMPQYAFSVYPIVARRVGGVPIEAPARDYGADVDALLAAVTERTRILFIANPNNPTGTMLNRAEVARLHAGLPERVLLVLDSAYAEYLDPTQDDYDDGLELSRTAPNVLMTRTFSKIHGLGGARVGWCHGAAHVIEALDKIRGPFNVTSAGQAGAAAALTDDAFAARSAAHNRQWRDWLSAEWAGLGNRGVRVVPSFGNFVMLSFAKGAPATAQGAYEALMADGYVTRWLVPQGMADELRVTVGTEAETRGVAASFRRYVEGA